MDLKPCPNCGSVMLLVPVNLQRFAECVACGLIGPKNDLAGEKWNALPRREEPTEAEYPFDHNDPLGKTEREVWREYAKAAMPSCPKNAYDHDESAKWCTERADAMLKAEKERFV